MDALFAPCGNDCTKCEAYIATITNDMNIRHRLADNFTKQFNVEIPAESINCVGCMDTGQHIGFCSQCSIRLCIIEKQYSTCADCSEFPCPKGSFIWVDGSQSKANLDKLRKDKL